MKKNPTTIILFIIILGLVSYIVYKNWKPKVEEVKVENKVETSTKAEDIVIKDSYQTKTMNPTDSYMKFDVKYPSFKNSDADFNASIEKLLKDTIASDSQSSKENWQARYDTQVKGDNIPKVPTGDDKFAFYSSYKVIQSNSNYISVVLNYGAFTGGAHGYENNVTFNYDVKNKKNIELKDLFPNDPNYLTYLSNESRKSLKKTFATVSDNDREQATAEEIKAVVKDIVTSIDGGTEPKEENFTAFTFTPTKIKLYFSQYQVGPYTFGSPEVEINRE
jgi:hypothetical protein